jgi:uncharacterized protein (TIGR03083 family)
VSTSGSYDRPVDARVRTAANRRRSADFFEGLDDDQLRAPSLCEAWTVREVLGHLVMPLAASTGGFVVQLVRARGSLDRASVAMASDLSRRPVRELTGLLRDRADQHGRAPGVGPMGQMADGCVHLRDCARPLGLPDDVTLADWRMVLDWLPPGVPGLVPRTRAPGLRLVADDQDWSCGEGEEVTGPSEALAMALAGRVVALDDLHGPGVDLLRARLPRRRGS